MAYLFRLHKRWDISYMMLNTKIAQVTKPSLMITRGLMQTYYLYWSLYICVCVCLYLYVVCITLMSYQPLGISNQRQLDCLFNSFPGYHQGKHQHSALLARCEDKPTTDEFPSQRTHNAWNVSMPQGDHEDTYMPSTNSYIYIYIYININMIIHGHYHAAIWGMSRWQPLLRVLY